MLYPVPFSFSLHSGTYLSFFFFQKTLTIRVLIGSEVGDVATCSIRSDEASRLMITMCRRQSLFQGTRLYIYLCCTELYIYLFAIALFVVLFSWFGFFWVQLYILE